MTDEAQQEFVILHNTTWNFVSEYAKISPEEHFAELYAVYVMQQLKQP
jgi:hypothetical protein